MYRVITSLAPCDRLQDIQHNMYVHVCRRRQLAVLRWSGGRQNTENV